MGGNDVTGWLDIIRLILFLSLLLVASVVDLKKRTVPDSICICMVLVSLLPPEPERMIGVCATLPLFIIGVVAGGIGGGDIKLVGAAGMVLGFKGEVTSLIIGLCSLLGFHCMRMLCLNIAGKKKQVKKREQAYPLVPFLLLGTAIKLWIGG